VSILTAAVLAAAVISSSVAAEPVRRFTVELAILAGDAKALVHIERNAIHRQGLEARIKSSLGTLRWLAREYLAARNDRSSTLLEQVAALRRTFAAADYRQLARRAVALARQYPLDTDGLRPDQARPEDVQAGRRLYRRLCMGCHEHPDSTRPNPAQDLFQMAKRLPEREFIARLVGGIRGTPAVGLHNPLSDAEIAGLAAYLKHGEAGR
jgi:mono/diheme cytochrome c family protein